MSENYFYSSLSAQEIEDTLTGAVVFNSGQELSTSQKAQARQNIGAGAENTGFRIIGYFDTLEDLQEYLQVPPQAGDAYGIGTSVPYDIYVWDAANEEWVDNGPLNINEVIDDYFSVRITIRKQSENEFISVFQMFFNFLAQSVACVIAADK